ncbi:MAG: ion transporter [Clostridia bacterium]|nr:ion transporter [Clostridia bacterium]
MTGAETARITKRRIFDIIQLGNVSDIPSRVFDYCLVGIIISNILVMILETFDSLSGYMWLLEGIENITLLAFCIEYFLRLWTAEYLYPTLSKRKAVLQFMISFDGIVELLTILPFFFLSGFVALRMLRVVRIFHLFRVNATYDSFNVIVSVLDEKKNQIVSSLFIVFILMLASSLCMYSVEHAVQPDKFRNALSGMWWSVSALLTVGYGDIYPVTVLGRAMAVVISFLGVGAVAIPTGIISAGFVEQYSKAQGDGTTFDSHVLTIHVDIDSGWIGKTADELRMESGMLVLMAERRGEMFQPGPDYRIGLEDVLCVYVEKPRHMRINNGT